MSIFSLLITAFTGCGNRGNRGDDPQGETVRPIESEVVPVPFPVGTSLRHLYITHQGMRSGSYYILKTTDAGTYMKISNLSPDDRRMLDGEDAGNLEAGAEYLGFADTVKGCEHASLVLLQDDGPVRELEEAIAAAGTLNWDGYRESVAMEGVLDSGDSYQLYLELSDGTTVTVDSYNARPAGFTALLYKVEEIFWANSDYSQYRVEDFDTSACTNLYVCFRRAFSRGEWRLELRSSDNRWTVVLMDPEGRLVEAGTQILDGQQIEDDLPFNRFLEIFKKHGAERWNGYEASDGESKNSFVIRLYFENGKEFFMEGSLPPEGFEAFRKEFVEEIQLFYNEYKT